MRTIGSRASRRQRRQLDLAAGTLCLDPGTTKNDDGREVDLTDELRTLLAAQVERVKVLERQLGRVVPYLFPHLRGARALNPVPGLLKHDYAAPPSGAWSTWGCLSAWP